MPEWEIESVDVRPGDPGVFYEATALYGKRDVLPTADRISARIERGELLPETRAQAFAHLILRPDVRVGEIKVTGINVYGDEVTGQLLRTIPVSRLVSEAFSRLEKDGWPGLPTAHVSKDVREQWPRGNKGLAAMAAADVYLKATMRNIPPVPEVAEQFQVSNRTAARIIAHARETGHLPNVSAPSKTQDRTKDNGTPETEAGSDRQDQH